VQFPQSLDTEGDGFYLGSYFTSAVFAGEMDDVAVFPTALSATQISALFTASGDDASDTPGSVTPTKTVNEASIKCKALTATLLGNTPAVYCRLDDSATRVTADFSWHDQGATP
jgi:hypothetical protein